MHDQYGNQCKDRPHQYRQHHACPGGAVRILRFLLGIFPRHIRVDTDTGSHRQCDDNQLQRINDRQRRQCITGIFSHKKAVHYIVQRLDQLCQHHRRRDF